MVRGIAILLSLVSLGGTSCAFFSPAAPHKPVKFSSTPSSHGPEKYPSWTMPPATDYDELLLAERERTVLKVEEFGPAGGGTTGAEERVVAFPDVSGDVKFKVKPMPGSLDGLNNAPRKELAAYLIQRLFLDPWDFVVPTTFAYCIGTKQWREEHGGEGEPNVAGLECELVVVALWLQHVTLPAPLYDEQRFLTDPTYAYYLSNFNVFTYVIGHRDGREGNFLAAKDDGRRQVFSVDNGIAFNPWFYNYLVPNWDVIRVAAVRRETVDRLRKVRRQDLDFLLVVSQLQVGEDGIARQVRPGRSLGDDQGAMMQGSTIQFGLTRKEIDKIWARIQDLIAEVDSRRLPVF
jgi:hypothetical protein